MVQKHRTKLKFQKEIPNYPADSALKYVVEEEVSFSFFWILLHRRKCALTVGMEVIKF